MIWELPLLLMYTIQVLKLIRWIAFKYMLVNGELYQWTVKDLLPKCLDSDQALVTRERYTKAFVVWINRLSMKWFLRWTHFYWLNMIAEGVESVNCYLTMCSRCLLEWCMLSLNHGHFKDGDWTSLGRFILLSKEIAPCWWLQIIWQSVSKLFFGRTWCISINSLLHSYCGVKL